MDYFFIAYLAMLVFLFTKLRRLQHSTSFQAEIGLLILVQFSLVLDTIGVFPDAVGFAESNWYNFNWPAAISSLVLTLSMFNLGRSLFETADSK
jgi:hypothetical protein